MATEFFACGTRGSFPTFGKEYEIYGQATTCYVIKDDDYAIVLDCGTGIVNAVPIIRECKKIDVILSHVHYDHIMGLYTVGAPETKIDLTFYGNFDAWTSVSSKNKSGAHTFWPEIISKSKQVSVHAGSSYRLEHGAEVSFKEAVHGNGALMMDINVSGKRICFTGDNEYNPSQKLEEWVRGCDYLIFDGSYTPEDYENHKGWGHSTWLKGCEVARDNDVKMLLITHYANTQNDEILAADEKRAKEIYENAYFAKEGMHFVL